MAAPNTLSVMTQIQSMITALNIYDVVALQALKDWGGVGTGTICEIAYVDDSVEHHAAGGWTKDTQGFRITSAVNFTKQSPGRVITQLANVRDQVVYLFQTSAYLGGTIEQVGDSRVRVGTNRISYMLVGGDDYLVHEFFVEVLSTWNTPIGGQGI